MTRSLYVYSLTSSLPPRELLVLLIDLRLARGARARLLRVGEHHVAVGGGELHRQVDRPRAVGVRDELRGPNLRQQRLARQVVPDQFLDEAVRINLVELDVPLLRRRRL